MEANIEYICEGCVKVDQQFLTCSIYNSPPLLYIHHCRCPWNLPKVKVKKAFVRVGQQKTKRKGK